MYKALKSTAAVSIIATVFSLGSYAADLEKIHFLIPGGAGGGWVRFIFLHLVRFFGRKRGGRGAFFSNRNNKQIHS